MNAGQAIWGAAVFGIIMSVVSVLVGAAMLSLTLFGITNAVFGAFGVLMLLFGIGGFYVLYKWFTDGVEEQ